jgi:ribosomal protein L14
LFRLTVTDNLGATGTDTVRVIVLAAPNLPPTANAGSDITITLPTSIAQLVGSGTDADGTIASYSWTKIGTTPPGGTLAAPTQPSTGVSGLTTAGTYLFRLTVTDNLGATGTDTVRVIVLAAPNLPPTANAGSDVTITLPVSATQLVGSGADADGTIASYSWTKIGTTPPGGTLAAPTQPSTGVSGLTTVGTYYFKLTVTDNLGATGTDTVRVIVLAAANQPPTANAGNNKTITLPTTTSSVNGSGTDADGTITGYAWSFISGPVTPSIATPAGQNSNVSGLTVVGSYVFRLTVTDNSGATGTDTMMIIVNPAANQPPSANAGNNITITLPATTTNLSGSGTDADGTITGHTWTFTGGPATASVTTPGSWTTGITGLTVVGSYTFTLTVTDNNGATATDDIIVIVNASVPSNQPPVASAGNNVTINQPTATTGLDGTASFDPDGTIASYAWSFVTGPVTPVVTTPAGSTTQVNGLTAVGTYVFQLRVTDNQGATDDDNVTIIVSNIANVPPVANAGNNITITLPTSFANLNGGGSSDPDGTIMTYAWSYVNGPAGGSYTITNPGGILTGITGLSQGTYTFRLTVTDNDGASSTDDIVITVNAAINQPPVANAGSDITMTLPQNSTMLIGSGYDPDGTIAAYSWTYRSGPGNTYYSLNSPASSSTGLNSLVQGVYVFRLTVTDNSGATGIDSVRVTVLASTPPANQPPSANAGSDITLTLPQNSTMLTGIGYDPDGTIVSYQWAYVSGPAGTNTYSLTTPNNSSTGLNNLVQGVYVFRLTVRDNSGATATDSVRVTVIQVANQLPTANAGADITITLPTNTTTLYGSGIDPDGTIQTYTWTYVSGPGTNNYTIANTGSATTGLYNLVQGVYVFKLTVTDNRGGTATDNITVTVNAAPPSANQPPTARTDNDITITLPVNSTQVHGNTSSDVDGVIAAYKWTQLTGPTQATITNGATAIATVSDLTTGIYTFELKVTDDDGASSTKTMKVTVLNQVSPKIYVKVYPNPTADELKLQYVTNANGKFLMTIYDANRRMMTQQTIDKTQVSITQTINVIGNGKGVYFIELLSPDGKTRTTAKFIKR